MQLKRWVYRLNTHEITVECGYTLWGWAQVRLLVDGKTLSQAQGLRFFPIRLDTLLEQANPPMPLQAVVRPDLLTVHCVLWAHGAPLPPPDRAYKGQLKTQRGAWPEPAGAASGVSSSQI